MLAVRRKASLPSDVARHLPAGDRPLRGAPLADGGWAVVARGALVLLDADGMRSRSPWHEMEHGAFDGETLVFAITWADRGRPVTELGFASDAIGSFLAALRERIQSSIVHADTRTISGSFVRVTIRRNEDDTLYSRLTAFGPLMGTPAEQRELDQFEREARQAAGLDD